MYSGYNHLQLAKPNLRKSYVPAIKKWWTTVTAPQGLAELTSELCQNHSISAAVAEYLESLESEGK
jgi:hypothetical protein